MPLLDLNLGGVSSAGKPLPEDTYEFRLEDLTCKIAQNKQSYNFLMSLRVMSENQNGRVHKENQNFQESTLPFVKAWLTALFNCTDEDLGDINVDVDDTDGTVKSIAGEDVIGRHVLGTIKHVQVPDPEEPDNPDKVKTYANVVAWAAA